MEKDNMTENITENAIELDEQLEEGSAAVQSKKIDRGEYLENAKNTLDKMFGMLGISADISIEPNVAGGKLCISTDNAGRLIGKKGQTLECIELVLNRVLSNTVEKGRADWISIDVDGYCVAVPEGEHSRSGKIPRDEMERLESMALDIAREVKKLHKPRVIGPFNPGERRIIHLALEKDPDVETISDAEADANRGKKITIRLVGEN